MKTLITALALATLIVAPTFTQSAAAAPKAGHDAGQPGQKCNRCYRGYPLQDWQRKYPGEFYPASDQSSGNLELRPY
jgi:hypothetical protein